MSKQKMKIRKSLTNRFRITKKGKVMYSSNFDRHLRSAKSKSQKRRLKVPKQLTTHLAKKIKKLIH